MKKATVIAISSNQKIILQLSENKTFVQSKLQGFDISEDNRCRIFFDDLLNKQIQISFNKNQKTIRYQNQSFLIKGLQSGALKINLKQIDESKLFTQQHKTMFLQNSSIKQSQQTYLNVKNLNDKSNSNILKQFIKQKKSLDAKIQYFSEHILLRIKFQSQTYLFKCYLSNFKQYFVLFNQTQFYKNKIPTSVQFKIVNQKYNLNTNNYHTFIQFNDEFQQKLINQGWISLNQKNLHQIPKAKISNLLQITDQTMKNNKGIYATKSEILSFIYAKNNYVGIVTNIIQGYIYQITSLKTKKTGKIQLSMVICPIGEDPGSYQCRQFARKNLIGKQVNVYLQKQQGLNTVGSITRIQDSKDIQSFLLQNGYAHVKQQERKTVLGRKYVAIQQKAKQKKKALHRKQLGNKRYQDLSQSPLNKSHLNTFLPRKLQILSKFNQNQNGVIQQIINALSYKIRIESLQVLINLRLQGVVQPCLNPNLKQYEQIKQQTDRFLKYNFNQRNIIASIIDFDQQNNQYIGTLYLERQKQKKDKEKENQQNQIQLILLKSSLVYADKYNFISKYLILESQVKKQSKLIWQEKLRCFQPGHQLDKQKYCFQGRFSWIKYGKIAYVQPKDNFSTLQKLQNQIRSMNLNKFSNQKVKIGAWCVAQYQGQFYRAVIKSKKDHNVTVQFFDWGNEKMVKIQSLKQLPQNYLYLQKQCIKVTLNLVAKTRNKEAIQKLQQLLFDGGIYVFKKVFGDKVNFYDSQTQSVNQQLIFKGYLKADKQQIKYNENREILKTVQEELRKQRVGIWDQSDSSQQETQEY